MAKLYGVDTAPEQIPWIWTHFTPVGLVLSTCISLFLTRSVSHMLEMDIAYAVISFLLLFLVSFTFWMRVKYWPPFYKHLFSGKPGMRYVQKLLEKLPDTYSVVANVPVEASKESIDFVILGGNGFFCVFVRPDTGRITYNGRYLFSEGRQIPDDMLEKSKATTNTLTDALQAGVDRHLFANPIVVFANPRANLHLGSYPIIDIVVIPADWLVQQIANHTSHVTYTQDEVTRSVSLLMALKNQQKN